MNKKILLLGSGELGKEFVIAAKRLGQYVIACDAYEGKIVDYTKEAIMIQMVGDSRKIDNFVDLMRDFTILEICRTGVVTLERGASAIQKVTKV